MIVFHRRILIYYFWLFMLWKRLSSMRVPKTDLEGAKEMITSFVIVDGSKEFRKLQQLIFPLVTQKNDKYYNNKCAIRGFQRYQTTSFQTVIHCLVYSFGIKMWKTGKSIEPPDEGNLEEIKMIDGKEQNPQLMSRPDIEKRKVVSGSKLWPKGIIPWTFNQSKRKFTVPAHFAVVRLAMHTLEKESCLKFPELTSQNAFQLGPNYLDIGNGPGCSSYVGYYGNGPQPVFLNEIGCMKIGTILHELCHSIGFYHEHSRTDRDKFIDILFNNVINHATSNFRIYSSSKNYANYDLGSIMHYGPKAYSRDREETIRPKDENLSFLMGQRSKLSFYDIKTINRVYNCTKKCEKPHVECKHGGFLDANCKCHCPLGLRGTDCNSLVNIEVCGGIVLLDLKNKSKSISFQANSFRENRTTQCFWLIKSPLMTQMRLDLVSFHLPRSKDMVCKQWLEIRYNMIGQNGPKYCGNLFKETRSFESSTNLVMISFQSSVPQVSDAKFIMNVNLRNQNSNIACNFEIDNDLCIFHQVKTDDFDWTLNRIPNQSKPIIPASGNNGSLHYLNIGMSFSRKPGETAIIESRFLPAGSKCITFYYNIIGLSVGQLSMKLITETGRSLEVFKSQNSGNVGWRKYNFSLEAIFPFKILIKATVGSGSFGNIAIDDISIKSGLCSKLEENKKAVTPIDCGFEKESCNFSWKPPSIAKVLTTSKSGNGTLVGSLLIFTWILKNGEEAIIRSPVVPYQRPSCLTIDYYIIGTARWNLILSIVDPANNNYVKILWSSSGENKISGRNHKIIKEINEPFQQIQVILKLKTPNNNRLVNILAIDHVRLVSTRCKDGKDMEETQDYDSNGNTVSF